MNDIHPLKTATLGVEGVRQAGITISLLVNSGFYNHIAIAGNDLAGVWVWLHNSAPWKTVAIVEQAVGLICLGLLLVRITYELPFSTCAWHIHVASGDSPHLVDTETRRANSQIPG